MSISFIADISTVLQEPAHVRTDIPAHSTSLSLLTSRHGVLFQRKRVSRAPQPFGSSSDRRWDPFQTRGRRSDSRCKIPYSGSFSFRKHWCFAAYSTYSVAKRRFRCCPIMASESEGKGSDFWQRQGR